MKDYSKIKALAQSIIECIGDESEGGDGTDIKHTEEERGGANKNDDLNPAADSDCKDCPEEGNRKKRKDDVIALFASTLASKFNK